MPVQSDGTEVLCWWEPLRRGIIDPDRFSPPRTLRRSLRDYEIRVDTAFDAVIDGCADPARPHGWITPAIREAYRQLHHEGVAHSVEAWHEGRLCGGLYGVAIGGLFAAESKFHTRRDASKAAVMGLIEIVQGRGRCGERLIDTQWRTPHLERIGVIEVSRAEYRHRLGRALLLPDLDWPAIRRATGSGLQI